MRLKYALGLGLSLLLFSLIGCVNQRDQARSRLETLFHSLAPMPGAVILQHAEGTGGIGASDECPAVSIVIQELYGTNQISFQEVLDFYTQALMPKGARVHSSSNYGITFDIDDSVVAISGPEAAGFPSIEKSAEEALGKFRTIYLIERSTLTIYPIPTACRVEP